ncbi:hypothetical protein B296_00048849, partial [Ensete ventricosum]
PLRGFGDRNPRKDLEASMAEEKASLARENATGTGSPPASSSSVAEEHSLDDRVAAVAGGGPEASPSPANVDGRSFSQLLAGAMASPAASPRPAPIVTVPVVAVPCFLTPTALVESQGFSVGGSDLFILFIFTHFLFLDLFGFSAELRSFWVSCYSSCSAKKKVEHCPDGTVVEVIYRGKHNHDPPQKHRYTRDRGAQSSGPPVENESLDNPSTEPDESDPSTCKAAQSSINETPKQQLYCSSDCEFDAGTKSEEDIAEEPDPKRRQVAKLH